MAELEKCFNCAKRKMKKTMIRHKKMEFEGWKCTSCKQSFFTEEQFDEAFLKIQEQRMKEAYLKEPIRVGHSLAMTFPKDIVEVFGLEKKKIEIKPDLKTNSIHLKIIP